MSSNYENTLQKIKRKSIEQPWVPLGVALTVGSFLGAYTKFRQGSKTRGVELLRYRVAFQTLTVVGLLLGSVLATGKDKNVVREPIKPKSTFDEVE